MYKYEVLIKEPGFSANNEQWVNNGSHAHNLLTLYKSCDARDHAHIVYFTDIDVRVCVCVMRARGVSDTFVIVFRMYF